MPHRGRSIRDNCDNRLKIPAQNKMTCRGFDDQPRSDSIQATIAGSDQRFTR